MTAFEQIFISTQMASMPYLYNVTCSIDIELLYSYYLLYLHFAINMFSGDEIVSLYDRQHTNYIPEVYAIECS